VTLTNIAFRLTLISYDFVNEEVNKKIIRLNDNNSIEFDGGEL
jgi:hypothetical protein